mgnify:CR=1 FL=1
MGGFNYLVMTIQELENNHQLAYKFVRGSTLYNTNIETSDVDYGGVFILPNERLPHRLFILLVNKKLYVSFFSRPEKDIFPVSI